ncbi:SDR family NAD(P)-dependent oxidoreductase [Actinoplanes sp. TBRC 11911]|uniref:SDR family NAD(P)-dependent oxidoreductase n=1 Tax=Actinoplanes sp. TBRC 11911 TaxID=2729386 RepID=UPI00145E8BF3|nr:SDR family NAD(P)-dependent oxidoreductase [Actinoplanes sp. TBRC 11911]NMO51455.1 SDR family NAD(P)-dependent oxidoreductase [Actinoplanes sp. TBRC 11911]
MIWFITGTSRGLGRALAIAALEAGDQVVASARTPSQDLVARFGDRVLPLEVDVTRTDQVDKAVSAAVERFGRLDVVVNNAGYASFGPIETMGDFRAQFETNFWGYYNVTMAALPILKEQGSGTIVQVSAIGGRVGAGPGLGAYSTSKFAIDGFTRTLAAETKPLGIRTMVVEPGPFETEFGSTMRRNDIPPEYDSTVGARARLISDPNSTSPGSDPKWGADVIVRIVKSENLPSHLPLGPLAVQMAVDFERRRLNEAIEWSEVGGSAVH